MNTVQESDGCQEPVNPVPVVIAPRLHVTAWWQVVDCLHNFTRQTVEDREIFGSIKNASPSVASFLVAPVLDRVSNDRSFSVYRSISSFHHQFSSPITVKVIYHELCVVGTSAYVLPQIDSPESFTFLTLVSLTS